MTPEPLRCHHCGAAVPLLHGNAFACPYCRAKLDVPAPYRELFRVHAQETHARHELETNFQTVSAPPARWIDRVALALVLFAPSIVVAVTVAFSHHARNVIDLFVFAIIPAMLPGAAIWIWSASVHATLVRFRYALAALPPESDGGPLHCRLCGAPLELAANAISARCAYCGTDSLIEHVTEAVRAFTTVLCDELRTLDQAIVALRIRKRVLVAGAAVAIILFAALVLAVITGYERSVRGR